MFNRCIGIYVTSTVMHVIVSLIKNKNRSFGVKLRGVLLALCLLSPAAESYEHWKGVDASEDDIAPQKIFMYITRAIEIVFESCPQAVNILQMALVTGHLSNTIKISMLIVLAVSSFGITDINIFFEMGEMNKQKRGVASHPVFGLLPSNKIRLFLFQLSSFFFHLGYLASSFLALSAVSVSYHLSYAFIALCIEYVALLAVIRLKNGRLHFLFSQTLNVGILDYVFLFVLGSVFQNFIPFFISRYNALFLGGRLFVLSIIYRLSFNYLVLNLSISKFEELGIERKPSEALLLMQVVTGVAVIGYLALIAFARDSHRWQLFSDNGTGKELVTRRLLSGDTLVDHFAFYVLRLPLGRMPKQLKKV